MSKAERWLWKMLTCVPLAGCWALGLAAWGLLTLIAWGGLKIMDAWDKPNE